MEMLLHEAHLSSFVVKQPMGQNQLVQGERLENQLVENNCWNIPKTFWEN